MADDFYCGQVCCLAHLVLSTPTIKRNVEAVMGMGGNEN